MRELGLIALLLTSAGCANSFEKIKDVASGAPDWYDSAREEIIGEGYPNIGSTPQLENAEIDQSFASIKQSRGGFADAKALFEAHPRAQDPTETDIELRALRERLNAKLNESGPAPTGTARDKFLTDGELNRFREIFRRAEER